MGEEEAVDGVVERLRMQLLQRLRVEALILFGSRVEGEADEWSDYDFIVVSPDFEGIPFIERGRLMFPLRERGGPTTSSATPRPSSRRCGLSRPW